MPASSLPQMIRLPEGGFTMGETDGDKFSNDTERPAHRVSIGAGILLGKFPVTVGEFRAFRPEHATGEDQSWPVVGVSWDDAHAYCRWLSARASRSFRLPSEAEWEYACRAGAQTPFAGGIEIETQDANFFYNEFGQRIGPGHRTPVGSYPPNAFGLHDLHGNVCEWCEDAWHPGYEGAPDDGSPWLDPAEVHRVLRGGAWDYLPRLLRCAWRDGLAASAQRDNVGFRLALTLSGNDPLKWETR